MPGRSRVKDDVGEACGRFGIAEQFGEFVEGGDLDRAGARKLLFHAIDRSFGQHAAIRAHDAVAVGSRCRFRIDVEREQAVGSRYRRGRPR